MIPTEVNVSEWEYNIWNVCKHNLQQIATCCRPTRVPLMDAGASSALNIGTTTESPPTPIPANQRPAETLYQYLGNIRLCGGEPTINVGDVDFCANLKGDTQHEDNAPG
jgi:hypothetical protein